MAAVAGEAVLPRYPDQVLRTELRQFEAEPRWQLKILLRNASHRPTAVVSAMFVGDGFVAGVPPEQVVPAFPIVVAPWTVSIVELTVIGAQNQARRVVLNDSDDKAMSVPAGLSGRHRNWHRSSLLRDWWWKRLFRRELSKIERHARASAGTPSDR